MQDYNLQLQGGEWGFQSAVDRKRFAENKLLVENRQGVAKDYITEEMVLPPEAQDYYNTYLTETEKQANITE
jgi:hypothetical protein